MAAAVISASTITTTGSIQGNGTIAHASSVSSSEVHHGTCAPMAPTMRAYSAKASAATTSATPSSATGVRNQIGREGDGGQRHAAEDSGHRLGTPASLFDAGGHGRRDAAVAAIALLVVDDGLEQVVPPEVGPVAFR